MDDQNKKPEEWNEFPFGPSDRKEDNGFRQESEDSFAETRREPETYTYGPFGGTSAYSSSNDRLEPTSEQGQEPVEVVASSREYRPFTVSGGGGGGRGGWDGAKPKRTSFRGIFSAFMVGVVAVGGLMFAADRGNWFGNETYVSNASTQNSGVKAASTTVNNAADVVRPNNIAKYSSNHLLRS
ncbi:hypothetical protein [Cohnella faecalis]|uniref:hypothetical protein n=1 Tax=Cohnella faecalis TaxID=2315694 RepID=UPI001F21A13F|nr:hypothetical protein [Cohnella faecalis]